MAKLETIANKILKEIQSWAENHDKLVVSIDGYAGSGKTTLNSLIAQKDKNVLYVHLDDFIKHWKVRKKLIEESEDKPRIFEHSWYRYDELEKLIRAFKKGEKTAKIKTYDFDKNDFTQNFSFNLSKKVMVIDGVFLSHPKHSTTNLIDRKIYLDVDFDKADERRITREKKKWGKKYLPEDHKDNWVNYFKTAYRDYVEKYKPEEISDLVVKI